jgi:hypothetical protein
MDLRNGQGILGWGLTPLVVDTATWTFPTNFEDPDVVWTDEAKAYDNNIATFALTPANAATWSSPIHFTIASTQITNIKIQVDCDVGGNFTQIDVDVYHNAAWHDVYLGSATEDEYMYFPYQASGVTKVRIYGYNGGGAPHALEINEIKLYVISAAGGSLEDTCKSMADFDNKLYFGAGTTLYILATDGASLEPVHVFGADISDLKVFTVSGVDYLFVLLGFSTSYNYMGSLTGILSRIIVSTAVVKTFQFACWVNTTVDTLYANDGVNTIRSTTNPLNGGVAWSDDTHVSAVSDSITSLLEKSGALYIWKTDMPYYLSSAGVVIKSLAPECKSGKSSHSGKNSTLWQGELFAPIGSQALIRIGTSNDWIQPSKFTTNNADFVGQVEACIGDEEYLYVITDYSDKIEILCGRDETVDDSTSWRYHPIQELTLTGCETAYISTVYKKRLWVSSTLSTEGLYYLPLPTKYGDITNDSNVNFLTGGTFETSWLHGDFINTTKSWIALTLVMGHTYVDDNTYFTVKYKLLGGSWSAGVNYTGTATSMTQTKFLAVPTTTRTSTMLKLQFTGVTTGVTRTPILLNYDLKAILYPSVRSVIECAVRCADYIKDKDGMTLEGTDAAYIRTVLEEAQASTFPVTFYDLFGTTKYVKVMPIELFSELSVDSKEKNVEQIYQLRLQEVSLS